MKSINGGLKANVSGFNSTFREAFPVFPGDNWTVTSGTGDIIALDGNAVGSSYVVISKSPLDSTGSESMIEGTLRFSMPIEASAGLHLSQRTAGQEFAFEMVSAEAASTPPAELTISSISQTSTTLTVTTTTAHNLKIGSRIGIYGVTTDSRLNYSQLVVATTPSTTQFTCTAGPNGTIPTLTASATVGYVYVRSGMAFSPNGTSLLFENGTATNASFYAKSNNDDLMMIGSGTLAGNHSVTVASTASVQPAVGLGNYNFRPTSEYRLAAMSDRVQWHDVAVDSIAQTTARATVTQVTPNNTVNYKLRFRGKNTKGLTVPVAKIVSAAKTGTTTATVVTDVAHGLTTGDYINTYGTRDQTNFPNLTTAVVVASVVNATTFTVVWGSAVTSTTYGGLVARVNGGQNIQGIPAQVVQSVSEANNLVTVVGSAAWTGLLIGDYVNAYGLRADLTGNDLGLDGVYRIRDIPTTTTLVLEPIDAATTAALAAIVSMASTNCGGAIIKRTDLRISFVRLFDYNRVRIDALSRPSGDIANALPVQVANAPAMTVSSGTITTVSAANLGLPSTVADVASAAITSTTTVSAITPAFGSEYQVNIPVTAVSGTSPTMDVVIQESDDSGTNWFDVYHFPRITATGMYRSPKIPLKGNRVRYVQTIGGTTPSFTRSINRLQGSFNGTKFIKRVFDRAISLTTANATTTTTTGQPFNVQECTNIQLTINIGTATTPPALQLEGSSDGGSTWYSIGTPLTAVASSTVQSTFNNVNAELVRARVSTQGATVVSGYVEIKAWQ